MINAICEGASRNTQMYAEVYAYAEIKIRVYKFTHFMQYSNLDNCK